MPETLDQPLLDLGRGLHAKAEGAFIALAAGDALGWPQELRGSARGQRKSVPVSVEFRRWMRRDGGRFLPYEIVIEPGEYSDDTQLTLAVARCRMVEGSGWWHAWTRTEIPLWTLYQRGGGRATRQAAASWVKGIPPWKNRDEKTLSAYFAAGGNGVAMRVLPHAVFHARHLQTTGLLRDVALDGVATHGHPRALVGAAAYAYAAWWLLRLEQPLRFGELVEVLLDNSSFWGAFPEKERPGNGWLDAANRARDGEYESLWHQVAQEMRALLEEVRNGLKIGAIADDEEVFERLGCFSGQKGSGTVSTAAAIYLCARYAAQPSQGVLRAAFATGADTDTLAAMTGGLMGCLAGTDWLPREWFRVQDCQYLRQLAAQLSSGQYAKGEHAGSPRTIGKNELERLHKTLAENRSESFDLDGARQARIVGAHAPKLLSLSTAARTWELKASDGQTLFITRMTRESKTHPSPLESDTQRSRATRMRGSGQTRAAAAGVKISVADVKAASVFYEKVLGLTPARQSSRYISYGALALVDFAYASDLLGSKTTDGVAINAEEFGSALSCRPRIEIQVNDLQGAFRRVEAFGGRVVQGMTCMPWGERVFHCLDPEGNLVEVVERVF
jgi:ADP-ribosylglycohydrolase/predicted enzyme related to lactoylglutathione lyase